MIFFYQLQGENRKYFKRSELIEQERKTYIEKYGSKSEETVDNAGSDKATGKLLLELSKRVFLTVSYFCRCRMS